MIIAMSTLLGRDKSPNADAGDSEGNGEIRESADAFSVGYYPKNKGKQRCRKDKVNDKHCENLTEYLIQYLRLRNYVKESMNESIKTNIKTHINARLILNMLSERIPRARAKVAGKTGP